VDREGYLGQLYFASFFNYPSCFKPVLILGETMRIHKLILVVLAFLITVNCNAGEVTQEPHAMFYYRIPLGGGSKQQSQNTFGFRVDRALVERGKPIDYSQLFQQPAIMDFKMDRSGVESLTIAGVDYLKEYRLLRADEDEAKAAKSDTETASAPAEAGESTDQASTEESSTEEKEGVLDKIPKLFKENQKFGLAMGAVLAIGFVIGIDNNN